tara:strand:- start:89 stop:3025 length:2937 start_codon:yes stop_codon:yes gene_type:complete
MDGGDICGYLMSNCENEIDWRLYFVEAKNGRMTLFAIDTATSKLLEVKEISIDGRVTLRTSTTKVLKSGILEMTIHDEPPHEAFAERIWFMASRFSIVQQWLEHLRKIQSDGTRKMTSPNDFRYTPESVAKGYYTDSEKINPRRKRRNIDTWRDVGDIYGRSEFGFPSYMHIGFEKDAVSIEEGVASAGNSISGRNGMEEKTVSFFSQSWDKALEVLWPMDNYDKADLDSPNHRIAGPVMFVYYAAFVTFFFSWLTSEARNVASITYLSSTPGVDGIEVCTPVAITANGDFRADMNGNWEHNEGFTRNTSIYKVSFKATKLDDNGNDADYVASIDQFESKAAKLGNKTASRDLSYQMIAWLTFYDRDDQTDISIQTNADINTIFGLDWISYEATLTGYQRQDEVGKGVTQNITQCYSRTPPHLYPIPGDEYRPLTMEISNYVLKFGIDLQYVNETAELYTTSSSGEREMYRNSFTHNVKQPCGSIFEVIDFNGEAKNDGYGLVSGNFTGFGIDVGIYDALPAWQIDYDIRSIVTIIAFNRGILEWDDLTPISLPLSGELDSFGATLMSYNLFPGMRYILCVPASASIPVSACSLYDVGLKTRVGVPAIVQRTKNTMGIDGIDSFCPCGGEDVQNSVYCSFPSYDLVIIEFASWQVHNMLAWATTEFFPKLYSYTDKQMQQWYFNMNGTTPTYDGSMTEPELILRNVCPSGGECMVIHSRLVKRKSPFLNGEGLNLGTLVRNRSDTFPSLSVNGTVIEDPAMNIACKDLLYHPQAFEGMRKVAPTQLFASYYKCNKTYNAAMNSELGNSMAFASQVAFGFALVVVTALVMRANKDIQEYNKSGTKMSLIKTTSDKLADKMLDIEDTKTLAITNHNQLDALRKEIKNLRRITPFVRRSDHLAKIQLDEIQVRPALKPDDRSSAGQLEEGTKVMGNYRGRGIWYPGRISRECANGTFDIVYDDGDKELGVDINLLYVIPLE